MHLAIQRRIRADRRWPRRRFFGGRHGPMPWRRRRRPRCWLDQFIAYLAQIRGVRVISRASMMGYRQSQIPRAETAHELDVEAVVEGVVLRSGARAGIAAHEP
jgi:hypothetical protein